VRSGRGRSLRSFKTRACLTGFPEETNEEDSDVIQASEPALGSGQHALAEPAFAQANEQFLPALVYRTGPYAPNGVPFANGVADYWTMINERDGGNQRRQDRVRGMRDRVRLPTKASNATSV